jgi:hypothetical protein
MHPKQKYLVFFLIPLFAFTMHKYYISLTKVEYKKESKSIQVTMRIFIDDLQETINTTYNKDFELALPNGSKEIDTIISNYLTGKFKVKINNIEKPYSYIGKEYENDVVYLYLEINNIETINTIEIKNNMMMEIFSDQKNIIKLNINNTKKTFFLTNQKDKDLLKF